MRQVSASGPSGRLRTWRRQMTWPFQPLAQSANRQQGADRCGVEDDVSAGHKCGPECAPGWEIQHRPPCPRKFQIVLTHSVADRRIADDTSRLENAPRRANSDTFSVNSGMTQTVQQTVLCARRSTSRARVQSVQVGLRSCRRFDCAPPHSDQTQTQLEMHEPGSLGICRHAIL